MNEANLNFDYFGKIFFTQEKNSLNHFFIFKGK